jgi:hypothetical protein
VRLLSLHTSEPRDVPRCGALSLLQKTPQYRGVGETATTLNVKLCDLVVTGGGILPSFLAESSIYTEIKSRRGSGRFAGHSRVLVCASVLRALPLAAPPASPHTQTENRDLTSKDAGGPRRGFVPQAPAVQTCISAGAPAEKLRPSTQTRRRYVAAKINLLLFRYSQIYLLCPAANLPNCSSPVATASRRWP